MKFTASVLFLASLFPALLSGQDFVSGVAAIRISHSWVPDRKIEGLSTEVGLSEWSVMSPIFYHKSETWSFGAGLRYESTSLDFSDSATLDEDRLQSIDLPLFLGMEQSEKIQWILMLNPSLSGDFEQVDGDTLNYLLLGGARYRKSETLEWFFGAVYSTGFDDDLFLPAIGFKWEPSEKSDLFFAGPILRYRYSFTDSLDLVLAGNLSGNRWNTEAGYGARFASALLSAFPRPAMEPVRETCRLCRGWDGIRPGGGDQELSRDDPHGKGSQDRPKLRAWLPVQVLTH